MQLEPRTNSKCWETKGTKNKHRQKLGWRFDNEKPKKQPTKLRYKPKIASPRSETKGTNFEHR